MGVVLALVAMGWSSVGACAEGSVALGGSGGAPVESPLVVSGALALVGGGGVTAAQEAAAADPEGIVERERSASAYEGLDGGEAAKLAEESFPGVVDEPAGGPPQLPGGEQVSGFVDGDVAQVQLGGGETGVIESTVPMAIASAPGRWSAIDLGLSEGGGGFVLARPLVELGIPKELSDGIGILGSEVSLTPVDASGSPLEGRGSIDGSTVFYENTQTDTDTVVKPTTYGFDAISMLRSAQSPQQLMYRVGLPAGASLEQASSGVVDVVKEGTTIASVVPPSAEDAAGSVVPVSMSVLGDTLRVSVDHVSGSYLYPIAVDPEFNETTDSTVSLRTWPFEGTSGFTYSEEASLHELWLKHPGGYVPGQVGAFAYQTNGDSRLYEVNTKTEYGPTVVRGESKSFELNAEATDYLEFAGSGGGDENSLIISGPQTEGSGFKSHLCASSSGCSNATGSEHNLVRLAMKPTGSHNAELLELRLMSATVAISQPKETHSTVAYETSAPELAGTKNVFFSSGAWFGPHSGAFEFTGEDAGLGVSATKVQYYGKSGWEALHSRSYLTETACAGVQCERTQHETFTYEGLGGGALANGEDKIRVAASDAIPGTWSSEHGEGEATLKVDSTSPHGMTLTGLPVSGEELELGENVSHIKAEASDGEGTVKSSGIKSLELYVDGRERGKASGSCSSGPCTAIGEWSVNGGEFGVGEHTLTVKATDNAGNVATKEYQLAVNAASPLALGPGSVNPESGDYALQSTDVGVSGGSGVLSVTRHFDSRNPTEGEEGPLGPQWTLSLGNLASLEVLPSGGVMSIGAEGLAYFAPKEGGGFTSPLGDSNLTLESVLNAKSEVTEYVLKDATKGTTTGFTLPSGAKVWMPTISKGPIATDTVTDTYQTAEPEAGKKIVEPSLELAPHSTVNCEPNSKEEITEDGCRALKFTYGNETKAKGENRAEWGEYKGRLKTVALVAYNPVSKKMVTTSVAEYEYDGKGRLRAEWNPGVSPALKTTYGYDAEGHVTAITPPAQEPWTFTYGTISGDSNQGRVLKVTRAPSSMALWKGELPKNTTAPVLSGTPIPGYTMAVSKGAWSNEPVVYAYQWEDCNLEGKVCTAIPGATSANYTLTTSDVSHRIVAQVTAINGGGGIAAPSSASGTVESDEFTEVPAPSKSEPTNIVSGPDGSLWFTEYGLGKIGKITPEGHVTSYSTENMYTEPDGITVGPDKNLWFAEHNNARVSRITTAGVITKYSLSRSGTANVGIASGPDGNLWFTESGTGYICKMTTSGEVTGEYLLPSGSKPYGITTGPDKNLWFTDYGTGKIGKITTSGTITEYSIPLGGTPYSIVAGPDGNLWFTNYSQNKIGKITTSGTVTQYSLPSGSSPRGIVEGPEGNLWFADSGTGMVGRITTSGTITEYPLHPSSAPYGAAIGPDKDLWLTAYGFEGKIEKFQLEEAVELHSPGPGATVEYGVPLEGTGAPAQMGINATSHKPEPEKWGQSDDPEYATAVFPPDEPQGWPASDYKHASVYYLDAEGRTVNVLSPLGGISTHEYNSVNEVKRTLSPDNRAAALKETSESKAKEVAELLDTKSTYNTEGQLIESLGPQHTVKLAKGEEVLARNHVHYYYNEGAKPVEEAKKETYDLVTKTTDGAQYEGKEADTRTTITSYSGQKNLGWTLRQPTSATTDPAGLDLTSTTEYDEKTGSVIASKAPAGASVAVSPPVYLASFGSEGSGSGQFKHPFGAAIDASGNVWVVDQEDDRIEKFSSSGSFLAAYGTEGSGEKQFKAPSGIAINQSTGNLYISDTANNRIEELNSSGGFLRGFGSVGSGNGHFKGPMGLAVDSQGNVWVADEENNRVQEFSATGSYLSQFGTAGSGNGQFNAPMGIAISEGEIYVVDHNNQRVQEFSASGEYLTQFGTNGSGPGQLKEPAGIAANPNSGDLFVSDSNNERVEEFSPAGKFLAEAGAYGTGKGQFHGATGLAVNATGELYAADEFNDRVQEWLPPGAGGAHVAYSTQFGATGSGNGQLNSPRSSAIDGQGNVWVSDYNNHRIEEFSATGKFLAAYGSYGTGNGQFEQPTGIDINQSTGNLYIADCALDRIQELSSTGTFIRTFGSAGSEPGQLQCPAGIKLDSGGNVWVVDSANDRVQEFSSTGTFKAAYGSKGSGNGQFSEPWGLTFSGSNLYVTDYANNRVQELSSTGSYIGQFGFGGDGGGEFKGPETIATDAAGNLYVVDNGNDRVEEFSAAGTFLTSFASPGSGEGQLSSPEGIAVNAAGDVYVPDSNNRIQIWAPANQAARESKTIYYTKEANSEYPSCGGHVEWENLACETLPAAQPEDKLPVPVTTITYNMWDQAETIEEAFKETSGTKTRTRKNTFDLAGRPLTSEESASIDAPLPVVTDKYNKENGVLETQSTTTGSTTQTITSLDNTVGEMESYTDAAENTAKYTYDEDGRVTKVTDGSNEGKSSQTYSYEGTGGSLSKLVDSAAGTFTASYDAQGKPTIEHYPNGMNAYTTYNTVGEATNLEYQKTTYCTEKCTWFNDSIVPSIHGETMKQASAFSEEPSYSYDAAGRLTQVQEIPAGEGCMTRAYAYDEESNRLSLTTYKPNTKGECATEEATIERHTYDEADRITDENTTYEPFGNTTKLPATDAGGSTLESTYYLDGQVNTQTQSSKTVEYKPDPAGRTLTTTTSGKTTISHYDAPGSALAWSAEEEGKWTRNIPGIAGELAAIQTHPGNVTINLHDLQGNIVATTGVSEKETGLLTKYNSTEFGVPNTKEAPPKYAWLGADGITSEFPTGTITQDGSTYVPQTGQPLETQGITIPTPTNEATPYTRPIEPWVGASLTEGAEREQAKAEQQRKILEEANTPPGIIPMGDPAGCEEVGTCQEGGDGGSGGGGGGGLGFHKLKRLPLSAVGCSLHSKMHFERFSKILVAGSVDCFSLQSTIELQLCLSVNGIDGSSAPFECLMENGNTYVTASHASGLYRSFFANCEGDRSYRIWIWAGVSGPYSGPGRMAESGAFQGYAANVCVSGSIPIGE